MTTWSRVRWAGERVRTILKPAIAFEFWATLVFSVSFAPASKWLLNRLVAASGQFAVADTDLLGFVFTVPGILFVVLGVSFVLAFWFAEQAAVLMISLHALRGTKAPVSRVLWENVRDLPLLVRLGVLQGAVFLLAAIPLLLGIGVVHRLLLSEWDFYYYFTVQPPSWWIAVAIVGVLVAAYVVLILWLYVRWILSIPYLLVDRLPPREALRTSWERTRGRFRELVLPLVVSWLAVIVASVLASGLIGLVASWLLADAWSLAALIPGVLATIALLAIVDLGFFIVGKILHVLLMAQAYLDTTELERLPIDPDAPLPKGARIGGWAVAGALLVAVALGAALLLERFDLDRAVETTGHRGNKNRRPENTLMAVQLAIDERADFAEIDVQTTADGVVVVLHDADLRRVASVNRNLRDMRYEELRDIDVGSWFDPEFRDARIPTLQQVIDLARGRIRLNIELKYTWEDPELARKAAEIIRKNDFVSQCVVSSLRFDALREIRRIVPDLKTGFIVFTAVGDLSRMDADFLSLSAARAGPRLVREAHRRGRQVHVWTVNDPGNALSMIEMGVDNILTDEPARIRKLVEEWSALSDAGRLALLLRNLIFGLDVPETSEL